MLSLWLLPVAAAAFLTVHIIYNLRRPGLKDLPGPWIAKFTDLYKVRLIRKGRFSYDLVDLHRKYGPTVRIGPDQVSITDRGAVQTLYGLSTNYIKSDWIKSSQTLYKGKYVPALMHTQDKQYHASLKRSIASAYSVSTLMGYEGSVQDTVNYFLRRLDDLYLRKNEICPLDKWLQWYSYDVIGAITMSKPMGLMEQATDVDNMLEEMHEEATYRAQAAVMPIIDWICRKNPIMAHLSHPTHKIMLRARAMVANRLESKEAGPQDRRDFIDRFLEAKEKHPDILNDRNMLGFVGSNLQAGSDTTAIVLRTVLYYTLKTPGVLKKLHAELDRPDLQFPIPFQEAFNNLPYTSAVIYESIRHFPPFALLLERIVPDEEGLTLSDGTWLPKGTNVGMFGYTMHRDKSIYGDDADNFNPDRWLQQPGEDEDGFKERVKTMKAADMSFGHGQRRCIGVHVAELQLWKVVPVLFAMLDIELVNPEKEWNLEQKFFSLQSGLDVRLKWRKGRSMRDLED